MKNKLTTDEFIEKATQIHGKKYNYELTHYIDSYSKVNIICSIHGNFSQRANHHIQGHGCPYCSVKITTNLFIKNVEKVHKDKYDYSLVNYTGKNNKIKSYVNIMEYLHK